MLFLSIFPISTKIQAIITLKSLLESLPTLPWTTFYAICSAQVAGITFFQIANTPMLKILQGFPLAFYGLTL